ncbi:unnamed protein product [Cylindrotheca closterium]|uniref:EGF-like domain-containing protein n=1 Tax=Cylindrotheca closterium TaxID=2856 RepID=A0AAD2CSQ8_9STRA|nr:unnamed protein product [Cylindrotheca closterium]
MAADAWSITMKKHEDESDTYDPSSMSLLIERVDRIESQASKSEHVIEDLQRRLVKAEQRLSPHHDNNGIPWRRILACTKSAADKCEHGEFRDRDIKPDEEYDLPMDIYSVVSAWPPKSRPFFTALMVIAVQITLLLLLLTDQIGSTGANELVVVPANVPSIVHAAQALATIIAIMDQDDLRSAIEAFFDGLPTRFKGDIAFHGMSKMQWNFSCAVRFLQGFLSVFASFVLAVQSETVFDVLLNFLGVKFVSELDDLAFNLSLIGYFGRKCERAAKRISEAQFQQDNRNKVDETTWSCAWFFKYAHVFGVFGILAMLLALFFYVLISQNSGAFSPQVIRMQAADGEVPFASLFRGCYRVSQAGTRHERRLEYEQMGFEKSGGKFGFCGDLEGEQAWTFMIGELATDPCRDYNGRSEPTTTYSILDGAGGSQWFAREGQPFGNIEVSSVLGAAVNACGRTPFDQSGVIICEQLEFDGHIDAARQQESRSKFFNKVFLNNSDSSVYTYPALTHPIFVGNSSIPGKYDLVLFTGQSWVLTDLIESNITREQSELSMQEYLDSDPAFSEILKNMIYTGAHVNIVTNSVNNEDNQYTPLGMRWFRMQEQDPTLPYNYPTGDQSRPVEIHLSCATCNNITNPCSFGGICLEGGVCDCINGGSGALCTHVPIGDAVCHPYFNSEQFGWDGGDCCAGSCIGPQCGLGGLSRPFDIDGDQSRDLFSILGYEFCEDPSMAPLTIELHNFKVLQNDEYNAVAGNEEGATFCSTSTINVRCDGVSYLHFPAHTFNNESDCTLSFTETIQVPFGSKCELSSSIACFGLICLDHNVTVFYGSDTESAPIQSGSVKNQTKMSFGVPSKCLTKSLLRHSSTIFDISTHQGQAARDLSNDGISEFICIEHNNLLFERYALAVLNASLHFKSSNWDAYQCHGWGIPAVRTACSNWSITSLTLAADAGEISGTIPTEINLLTNLEFLTLRLNRLIGTIPKLTLPRLEGLEIWGNQLTGSIPTELANLSSLLALGLASNKLTGTIPTELARLKNLSGIWFDDNLLTGPMPSELGALPLASLNLMNNSLTGEIPLDILALTNLTVCTLQNNNFSGGIAPAVCTV